MSARAVVPTRANAAAARGSNDHQCRGEKLQRAGLGNRKAAAGDREAERVAVVTTDGFRRFFRIDYGNRSLPGAADNAVGSPPGNGRCVVSHATDRDIGAPGELSEREAVFRGVERRRQSAVLNLRVRGGQGFGGNAVDLGGRVDVYRPVLEDRPDHAYRTVRPQHSGKPEPRVFQRVGNQRVNSIDAPCRRRARTRDKRQKNLADVKPWAARRSKEGVAWTEIHGSVLPGARSAMGEFRSAKCSASAQNERCGASVGRQAVSLAT